MSLAGAVIAGLAATFVIWVTTRLSTMNLMGLERYLGTLFTKTENTTVGFLLLYLLGVVFGLIYAALWWVGIGWIGYMYGVIFGIVQWLVIGVVIGSLPAVHAGIRSGRVKAPGIFMIDLAGLWAIPAGLANNALFGLTFAFVYQFFASRYDWVS